MVATLLEWQLWNHILLFSFFLSQSPTLPWDPGKLTISVSFNAFVYIIRSIILNLWNGSENTWDEVYKVLGAVPGPQRALECYIFLLKNYSCISLPDVSNSNFCPFQSLLSDGRTAPNLRYFFPYLTYKLSSFCISPGTYNTFPFLPPSLSTASRPSLGSVFSMKPFPVN